MTDRPAPVRDEIRQLLDWGYTPRRIAVLRETSIQAVHAHIKKLRATGWRPPREREE